MMNARSVAHLALLAVVAVSATTARLGHAVDYYWDSDGTTAGFGSTNGTWGTSAFISTSSAGTAVTANTLTTTSDLLNIGTSAEPRPSPTTAPPPLQSTRPSRVRQDW